MRTATDATGLRTEAPVRRRRAAVISTFGALIGMGVASFLIGVYLTSRDVANLRILLTSVQAESQKAKQGLVSQIAANSAIEARLTGVSAELEAIRPTKNTYAIPPNQSIVLSDGGLTIGLVGSPGSNNLVLNVNGEQKKASTGDVIAVRTGSDTLCRIAVQRFDLFKAVINVNCSKSS